MFCGNCGTEIKTGMKFCPSCGTPAFEEKMEDKLFCSNCKNELNPGDKFCPICGTKFEIAVVEDESKEEKLYEELKEYAIEISQIVAELSGLVFAKIEGTDITEKINELLEPLKKYGVESYEKNPINMTNWNSYTDKLKDFICILKNVELLD